MIKIIDKRSCCGCSACMQRCPQKCIEMREDKEGFLYPEVDEDACVDCGLCEKVCPLLNRADAISPLRVVAVKNLNEEERLKSSSGGVFIELAKVIIEKGGVVFGAVYDSNWEVVITYAETLDAVRPMMGSKYMQARVETAYKDAERFLKQGRLVLFTGSPCQIAGLRVFLRKEYDNLLVVDFLCHGVPSPAVWRRYLNECVKGKSSQGMVGDIRFRDKRLGWKRYSLVVRQKSISETGESRVLLSNTYRDDLYMSGFLRNVYLRPSCYDCRSKNGVNHSDLTIADFWGIGLFMPDFDDDKGVGLVLVNSAKGSQYFDLLPMEVRLSSLAEAKTVNGGFSEHLRKHPKREEFYRRFCGGNEPLVRILKDVLHIPFHKRFTHKVKSYVKRAVRSVFPKPVIRKL